MNFKNYLYEGIIVPQKIKITTSDVKKLNKQFKDYPINFVFKEIDDDVEPAAGYTPKNNTITVSINSKIPLIAIEALIQHEIIHSVQDQRSGNRMQADIEKSATLMKKIVDDVEFWDNEGEDEAVQHLIKDYLTVQKDAKFLNDEERMTYAYMFVKLRGSDNIKKVIDKANKMWLDLTQEKMNKKMLKYFYMYWSSKDQL